MMSHGNWMAHNGMNYNGDGGGGNGNLGLGQFNSAGSLGLSGGYLPGIGYVAPPPPPGMGFIAGRGGQPQLQQEMGGGGVGHGGGYASVWGGMVDNSVASAQQLHGGGMGGAYGAPNKAPAVGWGGQAIHDSRGHRGQYHGRGRRGAYSQGGGRGNMYDRSDNRSWGSSTEGGSSSGGSSRNSSWDDRQATEELLRLLQAPGLATGPGGHRGMPPIPPVVFETLETFDGRRLSFLLKELARTGSAPRAVQLFDALQRAGPTPLGALCDTYSYTAMVSVCIHQHDVQRALKLVSDMKQRGVECSVHTYTALMNVCIKCGKGPLALDAYKMMLTDGLQPNVITYNTLVDVYGKMGAWQQALGVLQVMRERCVAPVLRTYNTVMIACNICSQPREALALYEKMKSEGFCPNATTYNTLITAFGKVGQLERAMDAFQEMRNKGYPRSVVTYSTLISACERVGQWRKALDLFAEMRPDGCAPNTVTYNSLIKACSQGAQWEKALELFESMGNEGCRPDVVTFTALINACDKSGQWRTALAMFERMRACGCKPDSIVYNAVIDCLWETGVASAQCQALGLFKRAQKEGHFGQRGLDVLEAPGGGALGQRLEVNLHAQTAGVAMLGLYCWLVALFRHVSMHGGALLPAVVNVITDSGRDAREMANNVVKGAVACMMPAWGAPFRPSADGSHSRVLEATGGAVTEWLLSAAFEGQLCIFFPCAAADEACRSAFHSLRQMTTPPKADATEARCTEAFAAIKRFEQTHALSLQAMGLSYLEARPEVVSFALALGTQLQLSLEVVHDAVLLMDRLASTGAALQPDQLFVMMASCVKVAVEKTSGQDARFFADLELASGMLASALVNGEHDLHAALDNDTAAISSLRCLQVYLERMGCEFKDLGPLESMVKLPTRLTTESLTDTTFLNCRPSVVAAAILCSVRRCRGIVPYWPSVLSKMTGYRDMNSPELAVAVKAAQRLYKEWAGQNHVPLMFDRSDSSSSTQCGLGGSRGGSPRGGSPIMWGVASPLGTSPTSYGNGGSFNKLPVGGGARELTLGASYASSESSQSANGISPSQSPPGTSPRGEHLSELNLAALSLGGM